MPWLSDTQILAFVCAFAFALSRLPPGYILLALVLAVITFLGHRFLDVYKEIKIREADPKGLGVDNWNNDWTTQ